MNKDREAQLEIFGEEFEVSPETIDEYTQRCKREGEAFDRFTDNLPTFIHEDDYFQLWMATDAERAEFIEARRPAEVKPEDSPYFQRTVGYPENKPQTYGNIRF